MNVQNLLSHEPPPHQSSDYMQEDGLQEAQRPHQYPTRHSIVSSSILLDMHHSGTSQASPDPSVQPLSDNSNSNPSPAKVDPKNITFELLFNGDTHYRARLPMKVQIYPHDTTESIVSTVKNFFGLYDEALAGVSFEDGLGNTLIASYENFATGMTVYVRVVPHLPASWLAQGPAAPDTNTQTKPDRTPHLEEGFQMLPPTSIQVSNHGQQLSRPASRIARKQSRSPKLSSHQRSVSAQNNRSRQALKRESRENSFQARLDELNSDNVKGYNSSDGDVASVTSSFRARNEHLASAEISEVNIVEGGRRQKAKFESSELPLFVPPQVPATNSISSISPQRRSNGNENASPFARPQQRTPSWNHPLQSPQYPSQSLAGLNNVPRLPMPSHGHRLRDRVSAPSMQASFRGIAPRGQGFGILPTPDPTIASTISDEDVALQLMRLGDPSNMSHGRTSTSTMDDALSGRADVASSATSDGSGNSEDDEQSHQVQASGQINVANLQRKRTASMANSYVSEEDYDGEYHNTTQLGKRAKLSTSKSSSVKSRNNTSSKKNTKSGKPRSTLQAKKSKNPFSSSATNLPMSPASQPAQSRKASTASLMGPPQLPFATDDDLSTKPRCQRCRKSKKGCDRQRPCQRCKDAGIGIEGCVSEDEGNGRKGRFGRHMGVAIQKDIADAPVLDTEENGATIDGIVSGQDKSKKRKR